MHLDNGLAAPCMGDGAWVGARCWLGGRSVVYDATWYLKLHRDAGLSDDCLIEVNWSGLRLKGVCTLLPF